MRAAKLGQRLEGGQWSGTVDDRGLLIGRRFLFVVIPSEAEEPLTFPCSLRNHAPEGKV